jgi:peptide/nickel transport system substrate-binding protein
VTRRVPRRALAVVVLAVLTALAAGCVDDPAADPSATTTTVAGPSGELLVAVPSDDGGASPVGPAWSPSTLQIARAVYDPLATYDESNRLVPQLAASIDPDPEFTRWTIALRPGIRFHDGSPVDAEAVRRNLEAQRSSPSAGALLAPIAAVTAPDPLTVVVETRRAWSTFAHVLTGQAGYVASPGALDDPDGAFRPVGSGPFVLESWVPGGSARFVRNATYWQDGLPRLGAVEVAVVRDEDDRTSGLLAGRFDLVLTDDPVSVSRLTEAADAERIQLAVDREGESPKFTFVVNAAAMPFVDPLARQALASATDRIGLHRAAFPDVLDRVKGPVSDGSLWFADVPVPAHDVGRARQEATRFEAYYGERLAFTLAVPTDATSLRLAAAWQRQLAEAGIVVDLVPTPLPQAQADAAAGRFEAVLLPLFGGWHPDAWYPALHRSVMSPVGVPGANLARYGTDGVDDALDRARAIDDFATQVEEYRTVQSELMAGGAYVTVVRLAQAVGAGGDVGDFTVWDTADGLPGLPVEGGTVSLTGLYIGDP